MVRPASELHGVVPGRYGMSRAMPDGSTMAQLARQTVAIVLAGGRGAAPGSAHRQRAPSPRCPSAASSASSTSRSPTASTRASAASASRRSTSRMSLIRHLQRGWSFLDGRFNEFIELLPAQQTRHQRDWYKRHRRRGLPERGADPRGTSRAWSSCSPAITSTRWTTHGCSTSTSSAAPT